jgi:L-fucose mutarotase/ribose pyranase (RbsD/FucU family)
LLTSLNISSIVQSVTFIGIGSCKVGVAMDKDWPTWSAHDAPIFSIDGLTIDEILRRINIQLETLRRQISRGGSKVQIGGGFNTGDFADNQVVVLLRNRIEVLESKDVQREADLEKLRQQFKELENKTKKDIQNIEAESRDCVIKLTALEEKVEDNRAFMNELKSVTDKMHKSFQSKIEVLEKKLENLIKVERLCFDL